MLCSDANLTTGLREALAGVIALVHELGEPVEAFERQCMARVMEVGRALMRGRLEALSPSEAFTEDGVRWTVAVDSRREVMTSFGKLVVNRPLFRRERNGPTRCVLSERAQLIHGFWTAPAAKVASLAVAEMPMGQAEMFFAELGTMAPSKSSMLRLVGELSDLWEEDREQHEAGVRQSAEIPDRATTVVVSLDGVMVTLVGSEKPAIKAAARAHGRPDKGPAGFCEASVGVIAFYDPSGERLATRRYARMPQENKTATKAWIRSELAHIRELRPGITTVALADGAANNWSFLTELGVDVELVDFYHTAEHLHRHVSKANGAATLDTQRTLHDMRRQLLDVPGSAAKIFSDMNAMREAAAERERAPDATVGGHDADTSQPPPKRSCSPQDHPATRRRHQPDFFERHHGRMNYTGARARNLPIGSGVTESTCKLAVCDRMRRTGMRWTNRGGQAVLTLRAHRTSETFEPAWQALMDANARRRPRRDQG